MSQIPLVSAWGWLQESSPFLPDKGAGDGAASYSSAVGVHVVTAEHARPTRLQTREREVDSPAAGPSCTCWVRERCGIGSRALCSLGVVTNCVQYSGSRNGKGEASSSQVIGCPSIVKQELY